MLVESAYDRLGVTSSRCVKLGLKLLVSNLLLYTLEVLITLFPCKLFVNLYLFIHIILKLN